jgi:hypothetical protein
MVGEQNVKPCFALMYRRQRCQPVDYLGMWLLYFSEEKSMKRFFLPRKGNISFDHLALALAQAPSVLHLPDHVTLRTVVFQDPNGEWISFASRLAIGIGNLRLDATVRDIGPLRLVQVTGKVSEIISSDDLKKFLTAWRPIIGSGVKGPDFQDQVNIFRESSDNQFCKDPAWRANLYCTNPPSAHNIPDGPFFDPHSDFFALNIGDASAQWLSIPYLQTQFSVQNHVELLLPDRRAYIEDIVRDDTKIIVRVFANTREDFSCALVGTDYDGKNHHLCVAVRENSAEITLSVPIKAIQLFLMGADGFCYDDYYEDEYRRSRTKPVLASARQLSDQPYKELIEALTKGENEQIEFKEWIPTDRSEKKSYELLKVLSAFANSRGGVLYIGITDELEIKGLTRHLSTYQNSSGNTLDKKKMAYVQDLKRIIGEGISPTINTEIQWITHAGYHILRLSVLQGKNTPHQIIETRDIFVRRGGSCTKAGPSDLELLFKRDMPRNTPIDQLFRP